MGMASEIFLRSGLMIPDIPSGFPARSTREGISDDHFNAAGAVHGRILQGIGHPRPLTGFHGGPGENV